MTKETIANSCWILTLRIRYTDEIIKVGTNTPHNTSEIHYEIYASSTKSQHCSSLTELPVANATSWATASWRQDI